MTFLARPLDERQDCRKLRARSDDVAQFQQHLDQQAAKERRGYGGAGGLVLGDAPAKNVHLAQGPTTHHQGHSLVRHEAVLGGERCRILGVRKRQVPLPRGGVVLRRQRASVGQSGGGQHQRSVLDEVDLIAGVSGGSFTALAYALYGERLFHEDPHRFLKRNVQGEPIQRILNPTSWPRLARHGVLPESLRASPVSIKGIEGGRSSLAAWVPAPCRPPPPPHPGFPLEP